MRCSILFPIIFYISLSGCAPEEPLQIGIHPWIGYETLYLARDFGWLPPIINLHEGKSADDSIHALHAGQIDAACLTLDEVLRVRIAGIPLTIIAVFDISAGADVVLSRSQIKDLQDLAGKRIGVEKNALGSLMLIKLLSAANLDQSAITIIDLTIDQQLAAWRQDKIDVVVTYEPTATLIRNEGAQIIFDSRQISETIFDVLAMRSDKIQKHKSSLQELIQTHFRAVSYINTNRGDALYRIAAHNGITYDEARQIIAGITFPSLVSNQHYFLNNKVLNAARMISQILTQTVPLQSEDSLHNLTNAQFIVPQDE